MSAPYAGVKLHLVELSGRQLDRTFQDVLELREFAHIVKQRSRLYSAYECGRSVMPRCLGQTYRVRLNSANMTMSDLILGIYSIASGLNCRQVKRVEFTQMLIKSRLSDSSHRSRETLTEMIKTGRMRPDYVQRQIATVDDKKESDFEAPP